MSGWIDKVYVDYVGQLVKKGQPLFTLYTDTPERFERAMAELDAGFKVTDTPPVRRPLIIDRITP